MHTRHHPADAPAQSRSRCSRLDRGPAAQHLFGARLRSCSASSRITPSCRFPHTNDLRRTASALQHRILQANRDRLPPSWTTIALVAGMVPLHPVAPARARDEPLHRGARRGGQTFACCSLAGRARLLLALEDAKVARLGLRRAGLTIPRRVGRRLAEIRAASQRRKPKVSPPPSATTARQIC